MSRIVFMGTPEFAVASLRKLHESNLEIAAVVTAADKPAGRGRRVSAPPVKQFAKYNLPPDIPVLQPENLRDPLFIQQLQKLNAQVFAVVAFRMLPEEVWTIPPLGTVNLHASLLPQYRGAAPIQWALINGEEKTGLTTFLIDEKIDTGSILFQETVPILPDDDAGSLHDRMKDQGATLLLKTMEHILEGKAMPVPQHTLQKEQAELKTAPKIRKEHTRICWDKTAEQIHNLVRGLSPAPGAWDIIRLRNGKELTVKIFRTGLTQTEITRPPGTIMVQKKIEMMAATGKGPIRILEIQASGKKRVRAEEFLRGYDLTSAYFVHHSENSE
ncbi:MAG: methionyl-tRNA formyltransferase [Bacteroidales bacterium]